MVVEIGINPITWTNDDMPELGGDIPLETCLGETRLAGYAGTELGGKFPRTSAELGPILASHHLRLVSGWCDGRILEPLSQRPHLADTDWPSYGRKLTALADRMAAFGVGMAFHHHMGTIVQTDREIDLMLQHSGETVGLLFDTGHCLFAGGDPAALLRRHIARVVHVHCKDARRDALERARTADLGFMRAVLQGIFT